MTSSTSKDRKAKYWSNRIFFQIVVVGCLVMVVVSPVFSYDIPEETLKARLQLAQLLLPYTPQAFIESVENEDKVAIKLFLIAGMNPNTKDKKGDPVLRHAIQNRSLPVLEELIDAGADVNLEGQHGRTALTWAVFDRFAEGVNVVLNHGANAASRNLAFILAASSGQIDSLRQIVKKGVDLQKVGGRALRAAASTENLIPMVKTLLDLGIDVNSQSEEGWTPLLEGVRDKAHLNMVKTLLDVGADVNARCTCKGYGGGGFTPLLLATKNGYEDIARLLIARGADVNAKTDWGKKTPLLYMVDGYSANSDNAPAEIEVIRMLIDAGARKDEKDSEGRTALMIAEMKGHDAIISLLEQ